jgi:hypothetical protein
MFFDSQKIHIKQSPNAIKIYGDFFWNICNLWDLESMQMEAHAAHHPPGRAWQAWRGVLGGGLLERRLQLYFLRKEAYIRKKNRVKI